MKKKQGTRRYKVQGINDRETNASFETTFCSLVPCTLCPQKHLACRARGLIFALHFKGGKKIVRADFSDLVAQLVEHNTFNVGALGSSPSGITEAPFAGLYFLKRDLNA